MTTQNEPPDHHPYGLVSFNTDTFHFFRAAVASYESLLRRDLETIEKDADLQILLGIPGGESSHPINKELSRAERTRTWIDDVIEKGGKDAWDYDARITHGTVRFLKSTSTIYLEYLRHRRQVVAEKSDVSKVMLETIDQQLARFEEKIGLGVFREASPYPLLIDQIERNATRAEVEAAPDVPEPPTSRPRPVVLESIQILDPELRERCLDLLALFSEDGQYNRLDTVITEATRVLENRLRSLSVASATCVGVDLAKFALTGTPPPLKVSDISAEQDAAHLLYRGVFGFVRNAVHHRLIGTLQAERVLQVVGMIDYLISVAEAAERNIADTSNAD